MLSVLQVPYRRREDTRRAGKQKHHGLGQRLGAHVHGWPICSLLWPGNTTDAKSLLPVVQRFRKRFRVQRVAVVADRGMISKAVVEALESEELGCPYILGVRMRSAAMVGDSLLKDSSPWTEVVPEREHAKDFSPLKVKEVRVDGRRYVMCLNEEQQRKDAADREAIVASLRQGSNRARTRGSSATRATANTSRPRSGMPSWWTSRQSGKKCPTTACGRFRPTWTWRRRWWLGPTMRIPTKSDTDSDFIRTVFRPKSDSVPEFAGHFLGAKRRFGPSATSPGLARQGCPWELVQRPELPERQSWAGDRSPMGVAPLLAEA
jgi:hypothetical protein